MRGGLPLSYRGPGISPGKNLGNCGAVEAFFKPVLGQNVRFQNLILKASLTYFMQYFASILAYTGAVARIQRKKGNDQDLTKYLINDCSSFWIVHVSLWSTNCVVSCAECTLPPPLQKTCTLPPPPPPYFMQYFASILAYTGALAGIQRKKGNDQDLTKYLINDCSSFWIVHVSLWSTNCVVPCAECQSWGFLSIKIVH